VVYVKLGGEDRHKKRRGKGNCFSETERDLLVIAGFTVDGFTACHKLFQGLLRRDLGRGYRALPLRHGRRCLLGWGLTKT
jgi:hypothetical protein